MGKKQIGRDNFIELRCACSVFLIAVNSCLEGYVASRFKLIENDNYLCLVLASKETKVGSAILISRDGEKVVQSGFIYCRDEGFLVSSLYDLLEYIPMGKELNGIIYDSDYTDEEYCTTSKEEGVVLHLSS